MSSSELLRMADDDDQTQRQLYSWYDSVLKRSEPDDNGNGSALMRVKRSNLPVAVLFYIGLILSVTAIVAVLVNIYKRRSRTSRSEADAKEKQKRMEESIRRKRELLERTTLVVEEDDFIRIHVQVAMNHGKDDDDNVNEKELDLEAGGRSMNPKTDGVPKNTSMSAKAILNLVDDNNGEERVEGPPHVLLCSSTNCAICLGEYAPGDFVTWSTNPKCNHAYHNTCLFSWFEKGHDTCPFCRLEFAPEEDSNDVEEKTSKSGKQRVQVATTCARI